MLRVLGIMRCRGLPREIICKALACGSARWRQMQSYPPCTQCILGILDPRGKTVPVRPSSAVVIDPYTRNHYNRSNTPLLVAGRRVGGR